MTIRRRVTRFEEVIDTQEDRGPTTQPPSLRGPETLSLATRQVTETPDAQPGYSLPTGDISPEKDKGRPGIGRTWPDLAFAFLNKPEFAPTMLFVASLAIFAFAGCIRQFSDLTLPLVTGLVLNGVWFAYRFISRKWSPLSRLF
jgi:hypothetical protein